MKKKAAPAKKKAAPAKKSTARPPKPLISAQPQSQSQAATEAGVFLHTDDTWSKAYFDTNDLHCEERTLFG
jgi:hypothetical protein